MDNPQERLVSREYVAGLITGEGWFGLTVQKTPGLKTKNGFTLRPRFCIQMNDLETMDILANSWKSFGLPLYLIPTSKGIRLEVAGVKRVSRVVEEFLPLLTGRKKMAASIVKEYIDLRLQKPQNSPYGKEEFDLVNRLRNGANDGNGKRLLLSSETLCRISPTGG